MSSRNKLLPLLSVLAFLLVLFAFICMLFFTPVEQTMGLVQKVFYFHMSAAWVGMLAFLVAAVFGLLYLSRRDMKWDTLTAASVEVGLLFTVICILSGMIWARPIWNTWWTWDPRLTTVTIMAFTYIAFILLRRGVDNPTRRARFSAVYALIGFISVPLTFFSARLLHTIHPVIFGDEKADMNLNPQMLATLFISLVAFTVLYAVLLLQRARLMAQQDKLNQQVAVTDDSYDWGE